MNRSAPAGPTSPSPATPAPSATELLREAEAQRALAELFPHLQRDALRAIQDLFPLQAQTARAPGAATDAVH